MRYGWRGRILYSPDAMGGGGPAADPQAGSGDAGGSSAGDAGSASPAGDGTADDYADLAGDERVQSYLKAQTEKQFAHIPADQRSPEAYQRLVQAHQQLQQFQGNPQWQAFRAGQQGKNSEEQPFHAPIVASLEKDLGQPLNQTQRRFFGTMIDGIAKAMEGHFVQQHVNPLKNHLVNQFLDREQAEAAKLPDYKKHEKAVKEIVSKYGIPYEEAYKIAVHGKQIGLPPGEVAPATEEPAKPDRRSSEGDRPSGATAAGAKMGKYKNATEARNGAARFLATRGIRVE